MHILTLALQTASTLAIRVSSGLQPAELRSTPSSPYRMHTPYATPKMIFSLERLSVDNAIHGIAKTCAYL